MRDGPVGPLKSLNDEDLWNILSFAAPLVLGLLALAWWTR